MKISVIIPTHNRSGTVFRAIDSVLRQSFREFELIVVDDGSTDDTDFWLKRYVDPRLKILKTANRGVAAARNSGARQSCGEWLCFLDSDDVWHRHKLSEQFKFHALNPSIRISQTDDIWIRHSRFVNKKQKYAPRAGFIFKDCLELCLISASSVMLHQDLFWQHGGFPEDLPVCEDYALWLKITAHEEVGVIAGLLVTKFGGHADQLSKRFEVMDRYRVLAIQKILSDSFLSPEQKNMATNTLKNKLNIIELGRLKKQIIN